MEMVFVAHTGKLTSNLAELSAPAVGMKKCPFCAEWIRVEALLCRYCRCSLAPAEGEQQLAEANLPVAAVPYGAEVAQMEMDGPEWKGTTRAR